MVRTLVRAALVASLALAAGNPAPARPAESREHQQRYNFTHVQWPDGIVGAARVGLKLTPTSAFVRADYYTDGGQYLGTYEEVDGFCATEPDRVFDFTLTHYYDRQ